MRRTREVIRGLADDTEPHYGVSTGFGALATRHIPVDDAPPAAALAGPLARRRLRPRGRARGRARAHAAAHLDPRDRAHRHPRGDPRPPTSRCSTPASPRSCTSTARSAAPATSPRSRTARSPLMGEGDGARRATASGCRPPTPWPRPASRPSSSRRRRAWPSSTAPTACSGCCASPSHDLRELLVVADVAAAMSVEGLLGTDDVFAADLHAPAPPAGPGGVGREHPKGHGAQRDPRVAPHRGVHPRAGRLLAAVRPAGRRRRPRHRRPRRPGRRLGARLGRRQPRRHPRRPGRVATATSTGRRWPTCSTSSRSSPPTSPRSRSAAPTGSSTSPAATACRRSSPTTPASTAAT